MRIRFSQIIVALGSLLLTPGEVRADAPHLNIAAAANLQKIFSEALLPAFKQKTGIAVTPTFGSTKLLATQIRHGAPVDVFVAADTKTVDKLAASQIVVASTERVYAIGRLVMWTRKDAPRHPRTISDLGDPAYARIAIANPQLAPYGLAARQSFAKAGLAGRIDARIVQAENISQCLQYARSGNAAVALTALSLVIEDRTDPYVVVPDNLHDPLTQSAAVVASSKQPALAGRFMAFLTSKEAAPIWKRYGYLLPK